MVALRRLAPERHTPQIVLRSAIFCVDLVARHRRPGPRRVAARYGGRPPPPGPVRRCRRCARRYAAKRLRLLGASSSSPPPPPPPRRQPPPRSRASSAASMLPLPSRAHGVAFKRRADFRQKSSRQCSFAACYSAAMTPSSERCRRARAARVTLVAEARDGLAERVVRHDLGSTPVAEGELDVAEEVSASTLRFSPLDDGAAFSISRNSSPQSTGTGTATSRRARRPRPRSPGVGASASGAVAVPAVDDKRLVVGHVLPALPKAAAGAPRRKTPKVAPGGASRERAVALERQRVVGARTSPRARRSPPATPARRSARRRRSCAPAAVMAVRSSARREPLPHAAPPRASCVSAAARTACARAAFARAAAPSRSAFRAPRSKTTSSSDSSSSPERTRPAA